MSNLRPVHVYVRVRVYDDDDLVGHLVVPPRNAALLGVTGQRGDRCQSYLYRLQDGRYLLHASDHGNPDTGRSAYLMSPGDAADWLREHGQDIPPDKPFGVWHRSKQREPWQRLALAAADEDARRTMDALRRSGPSGEWTSGPADRPPPAPPPEPAAPLGECLRQLHQRFDSLRETMRVGGLWPGATPINLTGHGGSWGASFFVTIHQILFALQHLHRPDLLPGSLHWLRQNPKDTLTFHACDAARIAVLTLLRKWNLLFLVREFDWGLHPRELAGMTDPPTDGSMGSDVIAVSEEMASTIDQIIDLLARQAGAESAAAESPAPPLCMPQESSAASTPDAVPTGGPSEDRSARRVRLYDEDRFVGMVTIPPTGGARLGSQLLRGECRQRQLYQLQDGRFVFHAWDYDDPAVGRRACLTTPRGAAEWLANNDLPIPDDLVHWLGGEDLDDAPMRVTPLTKASAVDERRVKCFRDNRSVSLDGTRIATGLRQDEFRFFEAVVEAHPDPITFKKIAETIPAMRGKNQTRLKAKLPRALHRLVKSSSQGYYLELPLGK